MSDRVERIVEAFARGLAQGFTGNASPEPPPRKVPASRRREREPTDEARVPTLPFEIPEADPRVNGHVPVTFDAGGTVTQEELDRLERIARGEVPLDRYEPGSGVAPWMG